MTINTANIGPKYRSNRLPDGRYTVTIVELGASESRIKKTASVALQCTVEGRTLFHNMYCTEDALPYTLGQVHELLGDKMPTFQGETYLEIAEQIAKALSEANVHAFDAELLHDEEGFIYIDRIVI